MSVKHHIVILLFSLSLPVFSQVEINSDKLKELEDAARMAGTDPMAAHRKNLDFWWNGDLLSSRQSSKQVSIPIHNRVGGIQVTNDYSTVRRSTSKSGTTRKIHRVSPSEVNARINADREWRMEQARAKREAERLRKRAEDDLSEMRARMHHAIATAPYYAQAAAHDHWHATEGARILSEIKAKDLVQMPQRQETSGAELAAGIKPKGKNETKIDVMELSVLMKDRKFDDNNGIINVTKNSYLDEQQMSEWSSAIDYDGMIDISEIKSNEGGRKPNPILLVSHEELNIDSLCPFILPQYGLVALYGDSLIVMKDSELRSISWLEGCESSYVVVCGNKLIGKKGKKLNEVNKTGTKKILEFDTDEFSIFPKDNQSVYALCWYGKNSSIFRIDIEKKEYNEIVRLPLSCITIAANDMLTLVLVENDVFLIDENGKPIKFFKTDEYINDIAMTSEGLLVATDSQVFILKNVKEQSVFLNQGAKRLWGDGEEVYLQSLDNDLYLITLK